MPETAETQEVKRGDGVDVSIRFDTRAEGFSKEQLYKAEDALRKLGVSFDTGSGCLDGSRYWEWDWSLKGPVSVRFRGKN